ncbi:MAG: DNA cytosine methyltransferase [Nitrospira sp.]|nr:DNA cytosine methyltransferase [Nitrospira sp.]
MKPVATKGAKPRDRRIVAADLFCGVGGLTRGLLDAGIEVVAGYDIDEACRYPYEHNNEPAVFRNRSVVNLNSEDLGKLYPADCWSVLVGCAPCQPFSRYTQGLDTEDSEKWGLLNHFGRLVGELKPDVVSMENVRELRRHRVFRNFLATLSYFGYQVSACDVYCPDYGIPQHRTRLVVLASRLGAIEIIPPTHGKGEYPTVESAIRDLPKLKSGEICSKDHLHRSSSLSTINRRRIKHSRPGGTWRDWPQELVAKCHRKRRGKTYPSVYGRMEWEKPSPTITTQFYGFGNGRFGHPEQDRALSLREGAILQSFPSDYQFVKPDGEYHFKTIGRLIGNAVPVRLGAVVGQTIMKHLENHV